MISSPPSPACSTSRSAGILQKNFAWLSSNGITGCVSNTITYRYARASGGLRAGCVTAAPQCARSSRRTLQCLSGCGHLAQMHQMLGPGALLSKSSRRSWRLRPLVVTEALSASNCSRSTHRPTDHLQRPNRSSNLPLGTSSWRAVQQHPRHKNETTSNPGSVLSPHAPRNHERSH